MDEAQLSQKMPWMPSIQLQNALEAKQPTLRRIILTTTKIRKDRERRQNAAVRNRLDGFV